MKIKKPGLKGGIILSFAFAFLICLTSSIFGIFGNSPKAEAMDTSSTYTETVSDLYDDAAGKFKKTNLNWLYSKLGAESYNDLKSKVTGGEMSSADIRNLNKGKDIIVYFGGYRWTVTYVSTSGNDVIATLLFSDTVGQSEGFTKGWVSKGEKGAYAGTKYSNHYGSSYMRAVTLGNGGSFYSAKTLGTMSNPTIIESDSDLETLTATEAQIKSSMFYRYAQGDLAQFIAVPNNVSWQQDERNPIPDYNLGYRNQNETLKIVNDGWRTDGCENISASQSDSLYFQWGNDKVWLPSVTELGNNKVSGIWELSLNQLLPTTVNFGAYTRTGVNSYPNSVGVVVSQSGNITNKPTQEGHNTRPALHLNLKAAEGSVLQDGSLDSKPANEGNGTQASPYILWGDAENKAKIWQKAVSESSVSGKKVYVKLASNWIATESAKEWKTSFCGDLDTGVSGYMEESGFRYGCITLMPYANISFNLNGFNLDRNLTGRASARVARILCLGEYSKLELTGSGKITGGNADTIGGAALLNEYARLTLKDSVEICGNRSINYGGGIYAAAEGAEVIMDGGSIHDNQAGTNGGGLYLSKKASFTMNAGIIYHNTANFGGGCGFDDEGTVFNLNGGTISGNRATASGGGVYGGADASLNLFGGTITGNNTPIGDTAGVYPNNCHLSLKGAIQIYDNPGRTNGIYDEAARVYKLDGKGYYANLFWSQISQGSAENAETLNIEGALTGAKGVGIYLRDSANSPLTTGYGKYHTGSGIVGLFSDRSSYPLHVSGTGVNREIWVGSSSASAIAKTPVIDQTNVKYDGTAQDFELKYDSSLMDIESYTRRTGLDSSPAVTNLSVSTPASGTFTETLRGRYTITFKLKDNVVWSDGGTSEYAVTFFIREDLGVPTWSNGRTDERVVIDGVMGKNLAFVNPLHTLVQQSVDGNTNPLTNTADSLSLVNYGKHRITFKLLNTNEYYMGGSISDRYLTAVYAKPETTLPTWSDGSTAAKTMSLSEASGGVKFARPANAIVKLNGTVITGNTLNITQKGVYTLVFSLADYDAQCWSDGIRQDKVLTLNVKDKLELPKWSDGSYGTKYFDLDGNSHTVNFVYPEGVKVTLRGDITGMLAEDAKSFTVSKGGEYLFDFTLTDPDVTVWADGSTGTKTLTMSVFKRVTPVTWADGSTQSKIIPYTGAEQYLELSAVSEGVTLKVENLGARLVGNRIYFTNPGKYRIYSVYEKGYCSNSADYAGNLDFTVANALEKPTWEDGSAYKYLPYKASGNSIKYTLPDGAFIHNYSDGLTVDESNKTVSAVECGTYWINIGLNRATSCWIDGTVDDITLNFIITGNKKVVIPTFADGVEGHRLFLRKSGENSLTVSFAGLDAEGITVTASGNSSGQSYAGIIDVDKQNNSATIYSAGNYALYFNLSDKGEYVWEDGTTGQKALHFMWADATKLPAWNDGFDIFDTKSIQFKADANGRMEIPLTFPTKNLTITASNPNLRVEGSKLYAYATGAYTLSFKFNFIYGNIFVDASGKPYVTSYSLYNTVLSINFNVTGSQEVSLPQWEQTKDNVANFDFTGFGTGNPMDVTVKIPSGAAVTGVSNVDGMQSEYEISGDKVIIHTVAAGYYYVYFTIDPSSQVWADGSVEATKSVAFRARYFENLPMWADGSVESKSETFNPAGNVISFVIGDNTLVSCTDANARIVGNTLRVTAPGVYTLIFSLKSNLCCWTDNFVYYSKTLTFTVTGGTKVDLPAWADGSRDAKTVQMVNGKATVSTYSLPEGVKIDRVSGLFGYAIPAGNSFTLTESGSYTVYFKITDLSEYVWADGSADEFKTLTIIVTDKTVVSLPTWADGTADEKKVVFDSTKIEFGMIFDSAYVDVSLSGTMGIGVEWFIEDDKLISDTAGDGCTTVTFTLKDISLMCWADGTTAPRTLKVSRYRAWEIPAFDEVGTESKVLAYNKDGNIVNVANLLDLEYTITYIDENGINRGKMIKSGDAWSLTFNGKTVKVLEKFNKLDASFTATTAGTYIIDINLQDYPNIFGEAWIDGSTDTKTLTFKINPENVQEVSLPEWAEGGKSDKNVVLGADGSVTVSVKGGLNYHIVGVSVPASYDGTEVTVKGAGRYVITLRLENVRDYVWADGTTEDKTLVFYVTAADAKEMQLPEWLGGGTEDKAFTYSASGEHSVEIAALGEGVEILSLSNGLKQNGNRFSAKGSASSDVTYTITFRLKNTTDYKWSDGTVGNKTLKFSVLAGNKEIIPVHEKVTVEYAGEGQMVFVPCGDAEIYYNDGPQRVVSVSNGGGFGGDIIYVNGVGTYIVTIILSDSADTSYVWSNGSKTYEWTIEVVKKTLSVQWDAQKEYNYNNGLAVDISAKVFGAASGETPYKLSGFDGKTIGKHTATITLTDTDNYTFAGGKTSLEYAYEIKNLSTVVTDISVVFSQSGITLSNTDDLSKVLSGISKVTVTYDNGFSEEITEGYTLTGDFGAATPYFAVCYGGAKSDDITVTIAQVIDLSSVRVEEVEGNISSSLTVEELKKLLTVSATYSNGVTKQLDAAAFKLLENGAELDGKATLSEGKHTLTVSYTQGAVTVTDEVEVTVEGVKLSSIKATLAEGTKIYAGTTEAELKNALSVTAVYSDGSEVPAVGYTLTYAPFTAGGSYELVISYNGKQATVSGTVEADATVSVTVAWLNGTQTASGIPPVYTYTNLDDLRDYIVVKANGEEVKGYLLSGTLEAGKICTVTVTYANETANLSVSVLRTPSTVKYKGAQATFNQGNVVIFANTSFDSLKDLLKVEEIYEESGKQILKEITDYTLSGTLTGGEICTLTATWGSRSATFTVNVTAVAIEILEAEWKNGAQPVIYNTDTLDYIKSLLSVTAKNNDGTDFGSISADDIILTGTLAAGKSDLTLTVDGKSIVLTVEVTAVKLTGISVSWIGGSQNIKVYTSTNPEVLKGYIEVKAIYNNNAEGVVLNADEYELSADFVLGDSASPVTVRFNGLQSSDLTVKVEGSELTGITAAYTQGNKVIYSSASLDSLKNDLVVTAKFSGGAADEVLGNEAYTLSGDLTKGACVITVSYNGKTATFIVSVTEVALASVSAQFDAEAAGTVYTSTDINALKQYLTVTAVYGDGSSKTVTAESFTLSGNLSESGEITVSYLGKTATFTVMVESVAVETVAVSYDNTEEIYSSADLDELRKFLTVIATYNDKSVAEVSSYSLSGKLTAGKTCTITVIYDGKTATFDVKVAEDQLTTLTAVWTTAQPAVYPYTDIDELRKFITVTANGKPVDGYELTGDLTSPSATVTITYGGKSAVLSVTVTAVPDELELSVEFNQGNVKIFESADLSVLEGYLTVTATYGSESKNVQAGSYTLSGSLSAGKRTITVSYGGKTATFTVEVSKVELAYINARFVQNGEYKASAQLSSLKDLTVTAHYTDGTSVVLASGYALSGDLTAGKDCEITVTYEGKTASFIVTVSSEPVTFTISASYASSGKVFTSTKVEDLRKDITVTARYSDGTEKTVEGFTFVTEALSAGNCTVYVKYGAETASVTVSVLGIEVESISAGFNAGGNVIYTSNELSDLVKYLTVTAVNNDGSAAGELTLTAGSYKLEGELKAGKQTVTLTVLSGKGAGKTATFEVDVAGVKVDSLTVSPENLNSDTVKIYSTTNLDELKKYITVTANYNDKNTKILLEDDYTLTGTLEAEKTCVITVTYNGVCGEFAVSVEDKVLTRLEVTFNQNGVVYSSDSVEDLTSNGTLSIKAYYNDGKSYITVEDEYILSGQLTEGNCLITVNYGGLKDTFEVNVTAVTLVSVSATLKANSPELFTSTSVDTLKQFIEVTANYSNGQSKTLSADDYVIENEALSASECVLSITYDGKGCNLTVPVTAVKLEGIAVEHGELPAVFANCDIDELKVYLTVTATYTDGKMAEVTEYTINANLVAGEICLVTVSFGGQTASFDIEVQAKELKEIKAEYNGGEVDASASLEEIAKNVSVIAYFTDGTSEIVNSGFTLSGGLKAPSATLTVTYGDKTDSITVDVSASVSLTEITAEFTGNVTVFASADVQSLKGAITVTARYSDGKTKVIPADGYTLEGMLEAEGGECKLTVILKDNTAMTAEITVNVVKVELESITAIYTGGSLLVSDKLENIAGLTLRGFNNDGTSFDILGGYTLHGDLTVGECTVYVEYEGKTASFKVTVTDEGANGKITVTEISVNLVSNQPVFYVTSDTQTLNGYAETLKNYIEVIATYSEGGSKPVENYTVEGVALRGEHTLRVTYGYDGQIAYIDITLTAISLEELFADFDCGSAAIYTSSSLASLTQYLKVTGLNNDGSQFNGGNEISSNEYVLSGELTAGKCVITVIFGGKTAEFTVEVKAVKVESLTVNASANLPEVYSTASLDDLKQYLEVLANYNDGRPATEVSGADYTLSGELLAGRECEITVFYNGAAGTFKVTVKSSVLSVITAEYDKDKTAPTIYSSTDINTLKDYLKVTASFTGGAEDKILGKDEYTLSGDLTKDACRITVSFNGKTASFIVNVTEVTLITLSAEFDAAAAPEIFATTSLDDLRGYLKVKAYYSDGKRKEITEYIFDSVKLVEGENTVTVLYGEKQAKFTLNVTGVKLGGISAEFDAANAPKIFRNTDLESLRNWLTVTADYTDGKAAEVYDYTVSGTLQAGKTCTLVVSYGGKSATFDVTVEKKSLVSMIVNYDGASEVDVTATLESLASDVTVTVTYDDGSTETFASGFTVDGSVIPGNPRVFTVRYANLSGTFEVTVKNDYTLSKITAVFEQGNTRIYAGKTDVATLKNMLTVTAHYVDALGYSAGTRVLDAGEYQIIGNVNAAGSVSLKATFSQKEASFTVIVTGRELDSITAVFNPGSAKITASTRFNVIANYLTVTGLYNDGTPYNDGNPLPSNEYTITGDLVAGKVCTLTVRCGSVSATFDVAVEASVTLDRVEAIFDQTDVGTVYTSTDPSVLAKGLTVTAIYSDGTRVIAYPNYTIECDLVNGGVNPVIYVTYAPYGTQKIVASGTLTVTPLKVQTISASFNQNGKPITTATAKTLEEMIADGDVFLTVVGVYNDGSFAGVLTGYSLSYSFSSSGEVTVTYGDAETKFSVIVLNKELTSVFANYAGLPVIYENESIDKLKDSLTVTAYYTSGTPDTLENDEYTLTYEEVNRDGDYIYYNVFVNYFDATPYKIENVRVTLLKLAGVTAVLDSAYLSEAVIYDSMSAQQAAALVENYLAITGTYNDGKTTAALSLAEFTVSGDMSASENGKVELTLTYTANTALSCTVKVDVTKVALAGIEVTYFLQHTTAVYTSDTLKDLEELLRTNKIILDITATFNNGSTRILDFDDYTISASADQFNADGVTFKQGARTITVTYVHGAVTEICTFEVKVDPVNVGNLTATLNGKTVYTLTTLEEFCKMITVTASFSDGELYNPGSDEYTLNISGETPFKTSGGKQASVEITFGGKTFTLKFNVAKTEVEIDVSGMESYEFNPALTTQKIEGAKLTLDGVEQTLTYSNNTFGTLGELTLEGGNRVITVTVEFAGDDVYASARKEVKVIVTKAKVDMTGYGFLLDGNAYTDGTEVTYDPDKTYTLELDSSKQPVGITGVAYEYKVEAGGTVSSASSIHKAGIYTVTAKFTVGDDYEVPASVSVSFTVNKAQAVLDLSNVKEEYTYTGKPQTVNGAEVEKGELTDADISYSVNGVSSHDGFTFTNVAEGNGVTVKISIPETENYLGFSKDINIRVNKVGVTVTAKPKKIIYGEAPSNDGVEITDGGFVDGETLESLNVTFAYSYNYVGSDGKLGDVGDYSIEIKVLTGDLGNYNLTLKAGTLTVDQKQVDIIWSMTDVTYDGNEHKPLASYLNVNGVALLPEVTLADGEASLTDGKAIDAGKYLATAVLKDGNYVAAENTRTFEFVIKQAKFSVTKSGDSWFAAGLDYNIDKLITLDYKENGEFAYISYISSADIEIRFSNNAYLKGEAPLPSVDSTIITTSKPSIAQGAGSYVINFRIIDRNGNHETYNGQWSLDILNDTDPAAKFVQILFTKAYTFEYGNVPETEDELKALANKLFDEGYVDTSALKLEKNVFLDNVNLVLRADNRTLADKNTPFGAYAIYFEWKDGSAYSDWLITYKKDNTESDSNAGKLVINKKRLTAVWSETSFIANGTVHLPKLTVSGFNDGSVYELILESAAGGTFTVEKDGRTLTLTVTVNGNLISAGAHLITLALDNANFEIDGAVTAISITAPAVLTVTWDNTAFVFNGSVHLPTATISDGTNSSTFTLTEALIANGGTVEVLLGGVTLKFNVTVTGSGKLLVDAGKYSVTVTIDDERYTLPSGTVNMVVEAPAAPVQEGLSPFMIGIIAAVAVLAVLIIIVIIVVIKRKPSVNVSGDSDGFDDYYDE